ncbi:MAG TPA: carboxymuconolactone decarboxylase family protein [Acidimicrobiales bacterium]|nr:carboxymuconolactone decarboxylase family protein [Acidimicrobiales bacterium]
MAHVTLVERPAGLVPKLAVHYSRHRFGQVVEPVMAAAHHSGVLMAMGAVETAAERGWKKLDPRLRWLAVQAAGGEIGCSWCTDFGYYEGMQQGIDPQKVRDVPCFATSDVYDETERAVLDYALAATATPVTIPDELIERLHRHLSEPEIVELAAWVALENLRSRFNAGLGLKSQGFSDRCEVAPLPSP